MTLLYSGTYSSGVTLSSTTESSIDIGSSAYLSNSAGGSYAFDAETISVGTITSAGQLMGQQTGLRFIGAGVATLGTIVNRTDGTVVGRIQGIYVSGAVGTIVNAGYIRGPNGFGVQSLEGGQVTDLSTGTIIGADIGVYMQATATVTNAGTIVSGFGYGVFLTEGGDVSNQSNGEISGGIEIAAAAGSVTNAGYILGRLSAYGLLMTDGGGVANQVSGTISGVGTGLGVRAASAVVTNAGVISGTANASSGTSSLGVYLFAGTVENLSTGTITGGSNGIYIDNGGKVFNAGVISGANKYGVRLNGGTVDNLSTGSISAGAIGVYVGGTIAGTVMNAGYIGGGKFGVLLYPGSAGTGDVDNESTGTIHGTTDGVFIDELGANVTNAGSIFGFTYGASLAGGTVTNLSSGAIGLVDSVAGVPYEPSIGVHMVSGDGTVVNAGLIQGSTYAVELGNAFTNRVIVDPGGEFVGTVNGGATVGGTLVNTLELASGASAGLISGLGTQFINFEQTVIDAGAQWTLTGANTQAAGTTLTNAGELAISGGGLNDAGGIVNNGDIEDDSSLTAASLNGTGLVEIGDGGTLTISGVVSTTETIGFAGTGLLSVTPAATPGQIDGLGGGGRIELSGVADATGASIVNGNTLAIARSASATIDLTLDPTQSYADDVFPIVIVAGVETIETADQVGPTVISAGESESVTGTQATTLAANASGTGGITVTGAGASFTTTGSFTVGDTSLASLLIEGGGGVTTTAGAVIANASGAAGTQVDVSGAKSDWRIAGALTIGANTSGQLDISGGGTVTAGSLDTAAIASAEGQITVTGPGSEMIVSGSATISDDGAGVLSVLNGASFSAQSLTIGSQGDSSGALIVSGNGTTLTVSGGLNIGTALGTGDLTVGPGAVIDASVIDLQGGVVLEGGLLDPTVFIENGGSTTGGYGTIASGFILLEGTVLSNGSKAGKSTEVLQGTLVGGGTATIGGTTSVNSPGILQMASHDTIEVSGAVLNAATTTFTDNLTPTGTYTVINSVIDVVFQDGTGVLQLDDIAAFGGTIATWRSGDEIIVAGGTLSGLGVSNGNTLTVNDSGSGAGVGGVDSIIFASAIDAGGFGIINGDTIVACFAKGTRIETGTGWIAVEALAVGDTVLTADGGHEPIVWLGQRAVNCAAHPTPAAVWPVCVQAGAFGAGVPARDLYLSPDHAVFVNEVLVPVKMLINGTSIARTQRNEITYFHVELPRHAVIHAEGLPVESYLDTGDRANFHLAGATIRLFPDFAAWHTPEMARLWETHGAAPFVTTGKDLAIAKAFVAANAPPREFSRARSTSITR